MVDGLIQAALDEKARVARERELDQAKLREQQQRASDRQSQIDELRARRCIELCQSLLPH